MATDFFSNLPAGHGIEMMCDADAGCVYLMCICGFEELNVPKGDERYWFFEHALNKDAMLERVKARHGVATKGPWYASMESCDCGNGYGCAHGSYLQALQGPVNVCNVDGMVGSEYYSHTVSELSELNAGDAELITHSWSDIAFLLEYVGTLKARLEQAEATISVRDNGV